MSLPAQASELEGRIEQMRLRRQEAQNSIKKGRQSGDHARSILINKKEEDLTMTDLIYIIPPKTCLPPIHLLRQVSSKLNFQ